MQCLQSAARIHKLRIQRVPHGSRRSRRRSAHGRGRYWGRYGDAPHLGQRASASSVSMCAKLPCARSTMACRPPTCSQHAEGVRGASPQPRDGVAGPPHQSVHPLAQLRRLLDQRAEDRERLEANRPPSTLGRGGWRGVPLPCGAKATDSEPECAPVARPPAGTTFCCSTRRARRRSPRQARS